jgi:YVTN family beta-propeller protein
MGKYRCPDMFVQHRTPRQNIDAINRQDRPLPPRCGWRITSVGTLLALLVMLVMPALAAPRAQAGPPNKTAATAAPKVYVGLFKDQAIAVLDTRTHRVLHTIAVPPGPHGLAITPDGRKVYVSSDGASTVSVIDTVSDRVVGSIEVGPTPHGLAISPDGRQVLVAGFGSNQAVLIDTTSDRVVGRVPVPQPHNSAISADGRTAYVGSQRQGATAIVILDLVHKTQRGWVPLDKAPRALALSPDNTRLYVTVAGADSVQVLDPARARIVDQIPVGASPHHPLFTPDGHVGLVVSQGPGVLTLLDPAHDTVSDTVVVGKNPHWIATSSDGRTAYIANEGSNTVSVVDLVHHMVTATIPVGNAPRKLVVQPGPASMAPTASSTPTGAPVGVPSRAQTVPPGSAPAADHGTQNVRGQTALHMEADDYYFEPTFLRGQPGQTVQLEIQNESGTLHNFSLPALGIDKDIPPKGTVKVEVTFPPSGELRLFCKFHSALGMHGALLIGNAAPVSVSQSATQ